MTHLIQASQSTKVTAAQLGRLARLLADGQTVLECAQLHSATGMCLDAADWIMEAVVKCGAGRRTWQVFHGCAECPVDWFFGPDLPYDWVCPGCEQEVDGGDVHFEQRVTLTGPVVIV
jgi:hypothetical protein